jgi:oxalate decarboxylase/phosphoglucose isomerase-like protein (cupin superfamily)
MKYQLWPTTIHYEKGNENLVQSMFQSDVVNKHENKWYKDTDQYTEQLYNKIIEAVSSTWADTMPDKNNIKLNGNMLYIEPGHGARWHWHPWGWLSGIFYLQTSVGGELVLHPPTQQVNIRQSWFNSYEILPEPGDLVIFPSYLGHEVLMHQGPGTRLCLPFDLYVDSPGYEAYVDSYNRLT